MILDYCTVFGMVRVDDRYDPISLPGFFQEYSCNTREAFLTYVFALRSLHAGKKLSLIVKNLVTTFSRSLFLSLIFLIASLHSALTFVRVSVYLSLTELNCDCSFANSSCETPRGVEV